METEGEYSGYWWLPDNPTNKVPGTLKLNNNGVKLNMLGHIVPLDLKRLQDSFTNLGSFPIIYGSTTSQKCVTLQGCMCIKQTLSSIGEESYGIDKVFMGSQFLEDDSLKKLSFKIDNLNIWTWQHPFCEHNDCKDGNYILNYIRPADIIVDLPGAVFRIIFFLQENGKTHSQEITWHHCVRAEIEFKENIGIADSLEKYLYPIEKFFSFAMGDEIGVRDLQGFVGNDVNPLKIVLHTRAVPYKEIDDTNMLFIFPDIADYFSDILRRWFEEDIKMNGVINSFHAIKLTNYLEQKFSFAINAVEGYHRATRDNHVMSKADYKDFKQSILGKLDGDEKKFVSGLLSYANEPRLKDRLEELIADETELLSPLVENIILDEENKMDKFIRKVINTRNDMTHKGEEHRTNIFNDDELFYATSFLVVLIELYLFKALGFSAANIKKCIGKDYRYQMLMKKRGEVNGSKES